MLALPVSAALREGLSHPVKDIVVKKRLLQQSRKAFLKQLLAGIRLAAFPFVARAVIVDVFLLLDFADHRAAAMTAADEPGEGFPPLPRRAVRSFS